MPRRLATALIHLLAASAAAQPFPEVTDAERALTAVPGHPDADAVVLFKRAELRLRDSWTGAPSTLEVTVRTKVLGEAGKRFGQIAVGHGDGLALEGFAGRTVLPDGREAPLPDDAVFREDHGGVRGRFVTKAALPAVEVGAILDHRYRLRWSSVFVQPWTFDEPIPVRLSEIVYHQPPGMAAEHHLLGPAAGALATQRDATFEGTVVRVWGEDLAPVLEEPYGFPYADLTTRIVIVPQRETTAEGAFVPQLESWQAVCRRFDEHVYGPLRRDARKTRKRAADIARAVDGRDATVRALHAWVRDGLDTTALGIMTGGADSLDAVVAAGRGTYAEKALVLAAMLEASGVPARPVWAVDWRQGFADLEVVNPGWFEKVLVVADVGGRRLFLDPGENLAAGRLAPTNEGTQALIVDAEAPEVVALPASPAADSRRRAVLELAVDDGGGVAGRGRLMLTGHHAWFYLGRRETAEAAAASWRQWLANELEGFDVSGVAVDESVDEQRIEIVWTMALAAEHVLDDEVSLRPSRPLGPLRQRYTIPPEGRRTAVQVSFADRDELELTLAWPAPWEVDLAPAGVDHATDAGIARASLELDEDARRLVYRRELEIARTRYDPGEPYARLRELYTVMERHDARSLVLVRGE